MSRRVALIVDMPGDPRYAVDSDGRIFRIEPTKRRPYPWAEVTGALRSDGYLQLFGMPFNLKHQAVAAAFLGPCPEGKEVNHKNGRRADCAAGNLEYITRRENTLHGFHILHPENREHRAEMARRNGRKSTGSQGYVRTPEHRAALSARAKGHPAWWRLRGFSSLKGAI